jgi:hypothetical protein
VDAPEALLHLMGFLPFGEPIMVHLPRWVNLQERDHRDFLKKMLRIGGEKVQGFVVHDNMNVQNHPDHVLSAFEAFQNVMSDCAPDKQFFYEYAAGADPDAYAELFERAEAFSNISPCIDVGHVGTRTIRHHYAEHHSGVNVCSFRAWDEGLENLWPEVQTSVDQALPAVLNLIKRMGKIDKPLHFHLHDGHPISHLSPYGVSDHLSFEQRIDLPFKIKNRKSIGGMFGIAGLKKIIKTIDTHVVHSRCTATLEYHEQDQRKDLAEDADLFSHWKDTHHAEKMLHWCSALERGAELVAGTQK